MKTRFYLYSLMIILIGACIVALPIVFSRAQQGSAATPLQDPVSATTEEQTTALMETQRQALFTNRVPHAACATCFKVGDGRYGIYEDIPSAGVLIPREIPDPAPLEAGEVRPEFDEEGEQIWYVGHQGVVGPTDEEPVSKELPVPKIELRRIQARRMAEVFRIRGVHGFGIGARGFVVRLDPQYLKNESRIPIDLEGIPVEVELASTPTFRSHYANHWRPVPISSGIQVLFANGFVASGTLGPHIVRDGTQPGGIACCQIWSLTASHVVQDFDEPPPVPGTRRVHQPTYIPGSPTVGFWGYVAHSWSALACTPICHLSSAPINWTDRTPDVAAIAHISLAHAENPNTFVATGNEPIRKMRFGRNANNQINGPSGLIRTPGIGTKVKVWGTRTDAANAVSVTDIDMAIVVVDPDDAVLKSYKFCCVDRANLLIARGDSGALVAYDGTGNRHVAGIAFAGDVDRNGNPIPGAWFTKSFDIQTAFINAGKGFHYYWGTAANHRLPASTQCDGGC
jgi:hypothetical protein